MGTKPVLAMEASQFPISLCTSSACVSLSTSREKPLWICIKFKMRWASDSSFPYRAVFGNRVDTGWCPMAACLTRQKVEPDAQESMCYHYNHLYLQCGFSIPACDSQFVIPKSAHCGPATSWSSSRQWRTASSWTPPYLFGKSSSEFMQPRNYYIDCQWFIQSTSELGLE